MRTVIATAVLTCLLLNAGALASDNRAYLRAKVKEANVTVLIKNQAWPARHALSLEPCAGARCFEV